MYLVRRNKAEPPSRYSQSIILQLDSVLNIKPKYRSIYYRGQN
jgi:hypothetical protein